MSKHGKKEQGGILNYFGKKATAVGNWGKKTYNNVEILDNKISDKQKYVLNYKIESLKQIN